MNTRTRRKRRLVRDRKWLTTWLASVHRKTMSKEEEIAFYANFNLTPEEAQRIVTEYVEQTRQTFTMKDL
jgi:hypothetical protein